MNWKKPVRLNLLVIAALLFMPLIARADTTHPSNYSPPDCEFTVEFPSEYYKSRRCEEINGSEKCYDQVSYTKVFDMESTVNFRVICNPSDEETYNAYTKDVMTTTLSAMTKRSVVKTFNTNFREEDGFKQAGLVGEGTSGTLSTIYIAQLWVGKKSLLSVEAEMLGESREESDKLFSKVLKSVHFLTPEEIAAKTTAAPEANKDDAKETGAKPEDKKEEPKKE